VNVRKEIELYSADADKPVLNWLFDRYHYASQWNFVATCDFSRPHFHRIWSPTRAGLKLFAHDELVAALRKIDAFWTMRIAQLGALSDEAMEVRHIGRVALAKVTAQ